MTDDKNTLKITGDKGDTVDLKGNGWHQGASEDGYTTYTNNTVTIQIKDEIHVIQSKNISKAEESALL